MNNTSAQSYLFKGESRAPYSRFDSLKLSSFGFLNPGFFINLMLFLGLAQCLPSAASARMHCKVVSEDYFMELGISLGNFADFEFSYPNPVPVDQPSLIFKYQVPTHLQIGWQEEYWIILNPLRVSLTETVFIPAIYRGTLAAANRLPTILTYAEYHPNRDTAVRHYEDQSGSTNQIWTVSCQNVSDLPALSQNHCIDRLLPLIPPEMLQTGALAAKFGHLASRASIESRQVQLNPTEPPTTQTQSVSNFSDIPNNFSTIRADRNEMAPETHFPPQFLSGDSENESILSSQFKGIGVVDGEIVMFVNSPAASAINKMVRSLAERAGIATDIYFHEIFPRKRDQRFWKQFTTELRRKVPSMEVFIPESLVERIITRYFEVFKGEAIDYPIATWRTQVNKLRKSLI